MSFTGEIVAALQGMFMQHWTYVHGTADLKVQAFNPQPTEDPAIMVTVGDDPSY